MASGTAPDPGAHLRFQSVASRAINAADKNLAFTCHNMINNGMAETFNKQYEALEQSRDTRESVRVGALLTSEEVNKLEGLYNVRVIPAGLVHGEVPGHHYSHADRLLCYHMMVKHFNLKPMDFMRSHDVCLIDVGGSLFTMSKHQFDYAILQPNRDGDNFRQVNQMKACLDDPRLSKIASHNVYNHSFEQNTLTAPYLMFVHSLYDIKPAAFVSGFVRAKAIDALAVIHWDPEMLVKQSGVLPDGMRWNMVGDDIVFSYDDASESYVHNKENYLFWCTSAYVTNSVATLNIHHEAIGEGKLLLRFAYADAASRASIRLDRYKKNYVTVHVPFRRPDVDVSNYKHMEATSFHAGRTLTGILHPFASHGGKYFWAKVEVPADRLQEMISNDPTFWDKNFTIRRIMQYVKGRQSTVRVNGVELVHNLESQDAAIFATAMYLIYYNSRYCQTQTVAMMTKRMSHYRDQDEPSMLRRFVHTIGLSWMYGKDYLDTHLGDLLGNEKKCNAYNTALSNGGPTIHSGAMFTITEAPVAISAACIKVQKQNGGTVIFSTSDVQKDTKDLRKTHYYYVTINSDGMCGWGACLAVSLRRFPTDAEILQSRKDFGAFIKDDLLQSDLKDPRTWWSDNHHQDYVNFLRIPDLMFFQQESLPDYDVGVFLGVKNNHVELVFPIPVGIDNVRLDKASELIFNTQLASNFVDEVRGKVDPTDLRKALSDYVRTHEALHGGNVPRAIIVQLMMNFEILTFGLVCASFGTEDGRWASAVTEANYRIINTDKNPNNSTNVEQESWRDTDLFSELLHKADLYICMQGPPMAGEMPADYEFSEVNHLDVLSDVSDHLMRLPKGANAIVRLVGLERPETMSKVVAMAMCFQQSYICKPAASYKLCPDVYLVMLGRLEASEYRSSFINLSKICVHFETLRAMTYYWFVSKYFSESPCAQMELATIPLFGLNNFKGLDNSDELLFSCYENCQSAIVEPDEYEIVPRDLELSDLLMHQKAKTIGGFVFQQEDDLVQGVLDTLLDYLRVQHLEQVVANPQLVDDLALLLSQCRANRAVENHTVITDRVRSNNDFVEYASRLILIHRHGAPAINTAILDLPEAVQHIARENPNVLLLANRVAMITLGITDFNGVLGVFGNDERILWQSRVGRFTPVERDAFIELYRLACEVGWVSHGPGSVGGELARLLRDRPEYTPFFERAVGQGRDELPITTMRQRAFAAFSRVASRLRVNTARRGYEVLPETEERQEAGGDSATITQRAVVAFTRLSSALRSNIETCYDILAQHAEDAARAREPLTNCVTERVKEAFDRLADEARRIDKNTERYRGIRKMKRKPNRRDLVTTTTRSITFDDLARELRDMLVKNRRKYGFMFSLIHSADSRLQKDASLRRETLAAWAMRQPRNGGLNCMGAVFYETSATEVAQRACFVQLVSRLKSLKQTRTKQFYEINFKNALPFMGGGRAVVLSVISNADYVDDGVKKHARLIALHGSNKREELVPNIHDQKPPPPEEKDDDKLSVISDNVCFDDRVRMVPAGESDATESDAPAEESEEGFNVVSRALHGVANGVANWFAGDDDLPEFGQRVFPYGDPHGVHVAYGYNTSDVYTYNTPDDSELERQIAAMHEMVAIQVAEDHSYKCGLTMNVVRGMAASSWVRIKNGKIYNKSVYNDYRVLDDHSFDQPWYHLETKNAFTKIDKPNKKLPDGYYSTCTSMQIDLLQRGDLRNFLLKAAIKIFLLAAVAGSGKTTLLLSKARPGDLILTASKMTKEGMYKSIRNKGIKDVWVKTIDSYLCNFRNFENKPIKRVFIDEAYLVHSGKLFMCAVRAGVDRLYLLGDPFQIVNKNFCAAIQSNLYYEDLNKFYKPVAFRTQIYRFGKEFQPIVQKVYSMRAKELNIPAPQITCVGKERGRITVNVTAKPSPGRVGAMNMCMTNLEVERLRTVSAPKTSVNTVHRCQGKDSEFVELHRLNQSDFPIYVSVCYMLVAITRATKEFRYTTCKRDQFYHLLKDHGAIEDTVRGGAIEHFTYGEDYNIETESLPEGCEMDCYNDDNTGKPNEIMSDLMAAVAMPSQSLCDKVTRTKYVSVLRSDDFINPVEHFENIQNGVANNLPYTLENNREFEQDYLDAEDLELPPCRATIRIFDIMQLKNENWESAEPKIDIYQQPRVTNPTGKNILTALAVRNFGAPETQAVFCNHNAVRMVQEFKNKFFKNPNYRGELIIPTNETITAWLDKQQTGTPFALLEEKFSGYYDPSNHDASLKDKAKAKHPLDGNFTTLPQPQVIAATCKEHNFIMHPYVSKVKERILEQLKPCVHFMTDCSDEDYEARVNFHNPPSSLVNSIRHEIDMTKYDKSQMNVLFECEMQLYREMGVPEEAITELRWANERSSLRFRGRGITAHTEWQRKSGAPFTLLGNSIVLMIVLANSFESPHFDMVLVKGDDSCVWTPLPERNLSLKIADIFGLEAKHIVEPLVSEFCSKFVMEVEDRWVFVPNPIKLIGKMGAKDMKNAYHIEETRKSTFDLIKPFMNYAVFLETVNKMELLGWTDAYAALESLVYAVMNKARFKSYWEMEGLRICPDKSIPLDR